MAQHPERKPERRRSNRTALRLLATMRDGTRSRSQVRVIDMSTHGCRVQSPFIVANDSWLWLSITGLETQHCRVVWHCEEFVGLEFETPLSEAVFDRLLKDQKQLPETAIKELLNIATRTHWLARQASEANIAILAELSRKCAEDAVVEGLRLKAPKRP
jgi:hypothetical protein